MSTVPLTNDNLLECYNRNNRIGHIGMLNFTIVWKFCIFFCFQEYLTNWFTFSNPDLLHDKEKQDK